jgi:hypothetical protein
MQFYKLLSSNLRHRGFQYKEGLNIDTKEFNPKGNCEPGGLYYTSYEWIGRWFCPEWPLIADVTLPPDARIYPEPCRTQWKADRLVLSNIRPIGNFLAEQSEAQLIFWLQPCTRSDASLLQHIRHQTPAICWAAVELDPYAIRWMHEQTDDVCIHAVARNCFSLEFVKNQTPEIIALAMDRAPGAFSYVRPEQRTPELCLRAVQLHGACLQWVDNQTRALCEIAVKKDGCNIKWVKPELLTPELKELAKATACESCLTRFVNPR